MKKTEQDLWNDYRETHSDEARNALVRYHLPLVTSIAEIYCNSLKELFGLEFDDFAQEGAIELMGLLDAYNPETGAFSTFAHPRILGRMKGLLRNYTHGRSTCKITVEYANVDAIPTLPPPSPFEVEDAFADFCRGFDERETTVSVLHYLHGSSKPEIARVIETSKSTVRNVLAKVKPVIQCRADSVLTPD